MVSNNLLNSRSTISSLSFATYERDHLWYINNKVEYPFFKVPSSSIMKAQVTVYRSGKVKMKLVYFVENKIVVSVSKTRQGHSLQSFRFSACNPYPSLCNLILKSSPCVNLKIRSQTAPYKSEDSLV